MSKDAELVRATGQVMVQGGVAEWGQALEALAQRLEAGVVVPRDLFDEIHSHFLSEADEMDKNTTGAYVHHIAERLTAVKENP